jgi:hypothetical protein
MPRGPQDHHQPHLWHHHDESDSDEEDEYKKRGKVTRDVNHDSARFKALTDAINSVQQTCAADVQRICGGTPVAVVDNSFVSTKSSGSVDAANIQGLPQLHEFMKQFMEPRRLQAQAENQNHYGHKGMLKSMKSMFHNMFGHHHDKHERKLNELSPLTSNADVAITSNNDEGDDDEVDEGNVSNVIVIDFEPHALGLPIDSPPSPWLGRDGHGIFGGEHNHDHDHFEVGGPDLHGKHGDHDYSKRLKVQTFGYGERDKCIADNYDHLSSNCQDSVVTLGTAQESYSEGEGNDHHHHYHHPIMTIILLCAFGYLFYKRHKKMKDIRQILNVIDSNPELKQRVENAAGVSIPPHKSCIQGGCNTLSCAASSIAKIVLGLVCGLVILISSLKLTDLTFGGDSYEHGHHYHDNFGFAGFAFFAFLLTVGGYTLRKLWPHLSTCFGYCRSETGDASTQGSTFYEPLNTQSVHAEMSTYPVQSGTQITVTTAPSVVRPSSQLTML